MTAGRGGRKACRNTGDESGRNATLLDTDGRVHPYPRTITLRGSQSELARMIAVDTLAAVGVEPVRVGLIAHLHYAPDATWDVTDGGGGAATLALIDNAVAARSRPDEVLAHCAATARTARYVRGARGEANDAIAALRALLAHG